MSSNYVQYAYKVYSRHVAALRTVLYNRFAEDNCAAMVLCAFKSATSRREERGPFRPAEVCYKI